MRIFFQPLRPKKKIPVFPVTRPTLIFFADPNLFFAGWGTFGYFRPFSVPLVHCGAKFCGAKFPVTYKQLEQCNFGIPLYHKRRSSIRGGKCRLQQQWPRPSFL